jgi:hypothetical protein
MIRKMVSLVACIAVAIAAQGQQKSDTVIVSLGKTSKVIFTMQDRSDLDILKHYNFQDLFQDILTKIERSDTASAPAKAEETAAEPVTTEEPREEPWSSGREDKDDQDTDTDVKADDDDDDDDDEDWQVSISHRRAKIGRTWQSFNFDLGTNNYLEDGKFPDADGALYTVRPWGSWYIATSSTQRTRVGRNFFLEWGLGLSWYNFKFQNDDVMILKDDDGVQFVTDTRDVNHRKSKLTATYINASFVPVLDFGDHGRKPRMWDNYGSAFRIGIGPYAGYRISSRSKLVYKDDGDLEKEKNRDSFYLNNLRYGARLQLGFYGTDLFFNYDFNELFTEGKGPKLNAFSFGVIF